jgi:molybdate transport system substrate-binding protein
MTPKVPDRARRRRWIFAVAAFASCVLTLPSQASQSPLKPHRVVVAAAASMLPSLNQAIASFHAEQALAAPPPVHVAAIYASSGALARQIISGGPALIFISADPRWMDAVTRASRLVPGSRRELARNALVLAVPRKSKVKIELNPGADLTAALAGGRLVTADPDHAPLGAHARAALQWLGAWTTIEDRLVRVADAAQARILLERRAVAAGVLYASDVILNPRLRSAGTFPALSHPPSRYEIARIAGDLLEPERAAAAERFEAWLTGPRGQAILRAHGFAPPEGH